MRGCGGKAGNLLTPLGFQAGAQQCGVPEHIVTPIFFGFVLALGEVPFMVGGGNTGGRRHVRACGSCRGQESQAAQRHDQHRFFLFAFFI
jgi:hypothetical protein